MRILYLSYGAGQDYLRDCLFLGLRELLGPDAVDFNKLDSLYLGADRSQMYGKGMTLYGELEDIPVDRTDIPRKIARKYFDIVIYGSIHRYHDYLSEVTSMLPPERIAYIDGEDHPGYLKGIPGIYFKRELHAPQPGVYPIQFAVPASKILQACPSKIRLLAPMDPIDKSTYIYDSEADYYQQYADSQYAATMKKAGWDCLRHYEIMSQWTIPYFRVLESCPHDIMIHLPKRELSIVKEAMELFNDDRRERLMDKLYGDLIGPIMQNLKEHLTTAALAKYVIERMAHSWK